MTSGSLPRMPLRVDGDICKRLLAAAHRWFTMLSVETAINTIPGTSIIHILKLETVRKHILVCVISYESFLPDEMLSSARTGTN